MNPFEERFVINSAHLTRQRVWSHAAFGPAARVGGVSDHIRKELAEVVAAHEELMRERAVFKEQWEHRAQPAVLHTIMDRVVAAHKAEVGEWVDLIILALDGALRTGADPQEILDAVRDKQTANEARRWPDWRTMSEDEAIEHVRDNGPDSPDTNVVESQRNRTNLVPNPQAGQANPSAKLPLADRLGPDPLAGKETFRGVPIVDCEDVAPHGAHIWEDTDSEDARVCYGR